MGWAGKGLISLVYICASFPKSYSKVKGAQSRYFDHRQNYRQIEGNLKIILAKINTKEIRINHKETRMVKDGKD